MLRAETFFELKDFAHARLFSQEAPVWHGLNTLKSYIDDYTFDTTLLDQGNTPLDRTVVFHNDDIIDAAHCDIEYGDTTQGKLRVVHNGKVLAGASVLMAGACLIGNRIEIGRGVLVENGAMIKSPSIIGDNNEVRQGAYLRGYILSGRGCVLGHTTEIKHSIFLNDAKAGHFNYIGDSILGNDTNLGAGTKFANLRFLPGNIFIKDNNELVDTGMRKFGAILGDGSQTGCNSVTNPGTVLGKECFVMPNATARSGYHPSGSILR